MNTIGIKRRNDHYYTTRPRFTRDGFGDPIEDESFDKSSLQIFLALSLPGCACPLSPYTTMIISDVDNRKYRVMCDGQNKVTSIFSIDNSMANPADELNLPVGHGFFDLVKEIPVGQMNN